MKPKQLPSGNWNAKVYIGIGINGKRIYKSITAPTPEDIEKQLRKLAEKRNENSYISLPKEFITLGNAIDIYIASRNNILSPSTVKGYMSIRRNNLQPLMNMDISELSSTLIQYAVNEEAFNHSPKTIRNMVSLVSSVVTAYEPNFTMKLSLPKKTREYKYFPCDSDIIKLFHVTRNTEMFIPILLSSMLSLRRSEICGLKWSDIDFETNKLTVRRAMVLNNANKWILKSPKTYTSYRTLTMPPILVEELKKTEGNSEFVTELNPAMISNRFTRIIAKNGFEKFRFHDLRHYNASVMLSLNIPDKYAMERGGWSTPRVMKSIYQHTYPEQHTVYDEKISKHFSKMYKNS